MTEQSLGSKFRIGAAVAPDWRIAVDSCLVQMMPLSEQANIGFVFVSDTLARYMPAIMRRFAEATALPHMLGAISASVIARGQEYINEPAITCLVGAVPEDSVTTFNRANGVRGGGWLGIVHADPHVPALAETLHDMGEAAEAYLVGGLVASSLAQPQWANGLVESGISGVLFSEAQPVLTGLSQGCLQVGPTFTVTVAEGNMVFELDHRPAYEALQSAFNVKSLRELQKVTTGLMVGLPVGGTDLPDYLVRNIIAVDPQAGGLAIGAMVEEGDKLFFCRRDPESAGRDMDRMLADLQRRCGDRQPRGALFYSCMARSGDGLVQNPGELARIQAAFPGLPVAGMYCGGEIAAARLYGYTGVLALFL